MVEADNCAVVGVQGNQSPLKFPPQFTVVKREIFRNCHVEN